MSGDFFDRLELELATLAHDGAHLDRRASRTRRRIATLVRRGAAVVVLAVVLAASLLSEFPASATGHQIPTRARAQRVV